MGKYKVCVYTICKNEEQFVDRWMDSMSEADMIVVTDTGSTDGTVEKLRERGAVVHVDEVKPWRFDVARNISLDHVPEDADICVCTDLDELFEPGWREVIDRLWQSDTTTGKYIYNWSLKPDGTPYVQFHYSKIHSRQGFRWHYPIHEWLCWLREEPQKTVFLDGIVLNHYPDNSKSRGSYLPLLELAVEENPECSRMNYYLGREYMYKGEWEKCIERLKNYLRLPGSTWNEERSAAMRWMASSAHKLGRIQEAYSWYYRAIAEAPHMRDAYVEFARMGYLLHDWPLVFCMVEEALKIKERSKYFVNAGCAWDHTPDDLGAIACYWLGMYERSVAHARAAQALCPGDQRLQTNLKMIEDKLAEERVQTKAAEQAQET